MARHRKHAAGTRQTEAAALVTRRLADHRSALPSGTAAVAVLEHPPAVPAVPAAAHPVPADLFTIAGAVTGDSDRGTGVSGLSSSGVGVFGESSSGTGIAGVSSTGVGVLATSTTGNALSVQGKAHFSRSGSATVPEKQTTTTVAVSGMTADSLVLVTLQAAHSGVSVLGAVPAAGNFTVHLSKKSRRETRFAWFVLN